MVAKADEDEWVAVVQRVVANVAERVRAASATVTVVRQDFAEENMASLSVTPGVNGAAAFTVAWEESGGLAYLSVGAGTTLEIPEGGGRYTNQDSEEELRSFLLAIVEGRFSERVWTDRRGRVIATRARFGLPERPVTVRTVAFPCFFRFRRPELRQYRPYF